ncbi:ribosomal-protein-S18p-alanine acetyltransferase [Halarchaeum acidiphilum MH1-52-1]|uniref:Ribosomal-protein-S18p-alanine acetyltransferase n=1 Tax=Halarchaeum acidiphilum MH1-52-1 TaxID=1261545 RepID=U3A123_9EURY|nr:GNAT family N-acetyltransferase [Halarchaeum acidiphilum]GAD51319.1 ribosomal-protein-S18p-alanine acetyltransferase [Halarchaeum acidiphilum MH1-52-1]
MTTAANRVEHDGVRQARREDLLDVFRIEKESFEQPWPFSAFERHLGNPGFLVADDPLDGVAGYVVADTIPNHGRPLGHVKDIAVRPGARGSGLGHTLVSRGLGVLRTQGVQSVKLEVRRSNDAALSLYRDFDFEYLRTLPRYYSDGEDAFVMVARL